MNELQSYMVKSIIRAHQPVCYCIYAFCLGVRLSYAPLLEVSRILPPCHTIYYLFISLLAAMTVETGIAVNRGSTVFESARWKLTKKAIISVATWDVPAGY